uniref:Helicase ATP-binding domain-containing protein n=1 Tax=Caenorhabditis japonica TaxID=281687 RepID=A0A8R1EJD1_CAEJA
MSSGKRTIDYMEPITIEDSEDDEPVAKKPSIKSSTTRPTEKKQNNAWSEIFKKKKAEASAAASKASKEKELTKKKEQDRLKEAVKARMGNKPESGKNHEKIVKKEEVETLESQESSSSSPSQNSDEFVANQLAIGTGKALISTKEIIERRDKVFFELFLHKKYRSRLQMQAINCILKRKCDVYVSLPTGAGKSLCYQLPAVVHGGVTIVVSPLIALMKDQIFSLRKKGIPCETLNSTLTVSEKTRILQDLKMENPRIRMLYITAEGAATEHMRKLLGDLTKKELLRYIVIDEAHCVTQWGHDFRGYPESELSQIRTVLNQNRVLNQNCSYQNCHKSELS